MNKQILKEREKNKSEKGITLVALIITIIILLILAVVAIQAVSGDGIIAHAKQARDNYEKAQVIEQINLDIKNKTLENLRNINEKQFEEILQKYGTISEDGTILITTDGKYEILVSEIYSGKLESYLVTTLIENWEYTISGTNVILGKYIGTDPKIIVPNTFMIESVEYNTVLAATTGTSPNITGPFAFNTTIKEVRFEDNVTVNENINGDVTANTMFWECTNLEKLHNLPKNIITLNNTFVRCSSLVSVPTIPDGIYQLNNTFLGCAKLAGTITIGSNVASATNCFKNTTNEIILKVNKESTTYNTFNAIIDEWSNVFFEGEEAIEIACWGDSLTKGAGGSGTNYPDVLAGLGGKMTKVTNLGVGGEGIHSIAARQGAMSIYTNEFTIPATTDSVEIEIKNGNNNAVSLAIQGTLGLNPCYINGVEGNISYNADTKIFSFTRTTAGKAVNVPNSTQIITDGMKNHRNDLMIIWAGTNNKPDSTTIQSVITYIDRMLEYSNNDKYIVIGLTSINHMPDVVAVNEVLAEKYGEHFLDIRTYILENGLKDAGITATEQDTTDIAAGEIPTSLRSDNVHLNSYGYTIVGEQVYNKLISIGYINQ